MKLDLTPTGSTGRANYRDELAINARPSENNICYPGGRIVNRTAANLADRERADGE
jgi:hypothetical protein